MAAARATGVDVLQMLDGYGSRRLMVECEGSEGDRCVAVIFVVVVA